MADAQLSVELQARVDQFVANLLAAANAVNNTGAAVTKLSTNISQNIANVNRQNISAFTSAIASGSLSLQGFANQSQQTTQQITRDFGTISSNISSNVANINRQNVSQFIASLSRVEPASLSVATATTELSSVISRNVANINRQNISQFTASLAAGTLSVQRFNQNPIVPPNPRPIVLGANQAANALTNLGRVAQDAPFGFIGIQNNLNPLLESFQRLRAETGSNQAAFRALTSSLMGPAGIGIALSVVSAGILIYQQYQQRANKALQDGKKVTDDYIGSLEGVEGAYLKGAQNAAKEISQLNVLYNLYQNANLPLSKRKEAYKEIQEQYPAYFKNIQFEATATAKTTDAYNALTNQIIASAKARALSEKIGANAIKTAELQNKLLNTQSAISKSQSTDTGFADAFGGSRETLALLEQQKTLKQEIKNISDQDARLQKEINKQVGEQNAKISDNFGNVGSLDGDKNKNLTIKPKSIDLELPENSQDILAEIYRKISGINAPGALSIPAPTKLNITGQRVEIQLGDLVDTSKIDVEGEKLIEQLDFIANEAKKSIEKTLSLPGLVDVIGTSLGSSFEAMGAAIAEGGNVVVAAGEVLQKSFAELLSALGQQFITMGAAKVAAGILATPFGSKLVADGAGLIALGAGLKLGGGIIGNAGKSSGKGNTGATPFANGGIISGPTLAYMGEYAGAKADPEVVAPLSKLKNLLGQTDTSGNVVTASSGLMDVNVTGKFEMEGNTLVAFVKKTQDKLNRIG